MIIVSLNRWSSKMPRMKSSWKFCFFLIFFGFSNCFSSDISDLQAIGDFRSIKLTWNYPDNENVSGFRIRYCELNHWQLPRSRCKYQLVSLADRKISSKHPGDDNDVIIDLQRKDRNHYEASINSLRVQTNYSVSVRPDLKIPEELPEGSSPAIMVTTKSFTAKTLRCLANSSEIQVFTGPYFSGRISVEGSDNPACSILGDRNNEKESYNFTINHDLCKSKTVDNTRVETMVLVNENREILTHNSRRYLVICGFDPEKYTLTASVAVPSFLLKKRLERLKGQHRNHQNNQTLVRQNHPNSIRV